MNQQAVKRAAIYCRLSRDDDSSTSIATQEEDARALCRLRGWEVALVAADVGVSGSVRPEEREGFAQILAVAHDVDVIVARSIDRYSRSTSHFASMLETLDARGITIADTQGQVDLTSPYGRFVVQIMVAFAELERGTTQQRILRSRVELRQGGKWLGGAAPYGLRVVPDHGSGKRLEIDPRPAGVLREVVRRVSEGMTLSSEVARLNRTQLSPADYRKALRGELPPPYPGYARWTYSALYQLLRSEVLRGYRVVGKRATRKAVRDASGAPVRVGPPLLTDDEWHGLQRALDAAAQTNRRPRTKASLLLHVAWCETCDETLYRNQRTARNGKDTSFYTCPAARGTGGSPDCPGVAVSAARAEQHVTEWYLDTWGHLPYARRVLVDAGESRGPAVEDLRADVEELAQALVGLRGTAKDAVMRQLEARQEALDEALRRPVSAPRWELVRTGQTVAGRWAQADTAERRVMLLEHRTRAWVAPAKGRQWDPERIYCDVHSDDPAQDELDAIADEAAWDALLGD